MDHEKFMRLAIAEARKSPPKPTNYCVGAVLVDTVSNKVLSTGYTLELEGNTHAEQCCLAKFAKANSLPEERVGEALPVAMQAALYTSMEPCVERLSGNLPCLDRIIRTRDPASRSGIHTVYTGVTEPETFVKANSSKARLRESGIECVHVAGFEAEILEIATAGHEKKS